MDRLGGLIGECVICRGWREKRKRRGIEYMGIETERGES